MRPAMKAITIETLRGTKFFIDNVGSSFMVTDETMREANFFSTLAQALQYVMAKA